MKNIIVILLLFLAGCASPFPSGVTHSLLPDGRHEYVFRAIFAEHMTDGRQDMMVSWIKDYREIKVLVPDRKDETGAELTGTGRWVEKDCFEESDEVTIDLPERTITIIRTNKLRNPPHFCDFIARTMGAMPYWSEYIARDRKSGRLVDGLYEPIHQDFVLFDQIGLRILGPPHVSQVIPFTTNSVLVEIAHPPYGTNATGYLTHFSVTCSNGCFAADYNSLPIPTKGLKTITVDDFEMPIRFAKNETGALRFNKATALCMCHDWYMMRIYDSGGKYIAERKVGSHGNFCPAVFDFDNDGIDEILIYRFTSEIEILGTATREITTNASTATNQSAPLRVPD